jgi:hypothetical protein
MPFLLLLCLIPAGALAAYTFTREPPHERRRVQTVPEESTSIREEPTPPGPRPDKGGGSTPKAKDFAVGNEPMSPLEEKAIDLLVEINKYLMGIATALFAVVAFYLKSYRRALRRRLALSCLVSALAFLVLGYVSSFFAYSELLSDMAANNLGIRPGKSVIVHFLSCEAYACGSATVILFSLIIMQFMTDPVPAKE